MGERAEVRMLVIVLLVAFAGGLGGALNAVMSGPRFGGRVVERVDQLPVLVPGSFGNVLVGAAAALISFGLYGPLANVAFITLGTAARAQAQTPSANPAPTPPPTQGLTLAALAGAILVGFSGGRWLTAESEKQYSKATAAMVAQIATALPLPPRPFREEPAPRPFREELAPRPFREELAPGSTIHFSLQALSRSIQTDPPAIAYEKALRILSQMGH